MAGGEVSSEGGGAGNGCPAGQTKYNAIRLGYAVNGRTVTFVHDETWCWAEGQTCPTATSVWAREFRYDGARARYMSRTVSPTNLEQELSTLWTDYDGGSAYGDWEVNGTTVTNLRSLQPGMARTENPLTAAVTDYYHTDHLATTRLMSDPSGSAIEPAVYTAFGERVSALIDGPEDRYGYVGAFGYQGHFIEGPGDPVGAFPFLHVGERYYDPASGRFLQRDPVGIRGGRNVYGYVGASPSQFADPLGLSGGLLPGPQKKPWDPLRPRQERDPERKALEPEVIQRYEDMQRQIKESEDWIENAQWWLEVPVVIVSMPLAWWTNVPLWMQWALWCAGAGAWATG